MKKVFLLAAGLAMILTACQKEESLPIPVGYAPRQLLLLFRKNCRLVPWRRTSATVPPTLSAKIYPSQTETVLKVPAEAIGDYKTATNWNTGRFKAIEAIE